MPDDVYTHGHHDSVLRSHRWRTAENSAVYLLPFLRPGMSLLDVGCGPGSLTIDLAVRVSPGPVLGLDLAEAVLDRLLQDQSQLSEQSIGELRDIANRMHRLATAENHKEADALVDLSRKCSVDAVVEGLKLGDARFGGGR